MIGPGRVLQVGLLMGALVGCVTAPSSRPVPAGKAPAPSGVFAKPLRTYVVLSRFGSRGRRFHTGLDMRGRRGGGDSVFASRAGVVARAETRGGYGRLVEIQHPDGYSTRYAHLRKILVRKGQTVAQGEELGTVGDSGRATTAHLHFEILTPAYHFTDPAPFLAGAETNP